MEKPNNVSMADDDEFTITQLFNGVSEHLDDT